MLPILPLAEIQRRLLEHSYKFQALIPILAAPASAEWPPAMASISCWHISGL
jgi:hypothetical protein